MGDLIASYSCRGFTEVCYCCLYLVVIWAGEQAASEHLHRAGVGFPLYGFLFTVGLVWECPATGHGCILRRHD